MVTIRLADITDTRQVQDMLRIHHNVFGFIPLRAIEESIRRKEAIVAMEEGRTVGIARFHHRRDKITTLHEIAVHPDAAGRGIGRQMLEWIEEEGCRRGQKAIRLKCPIDNPANGFYAHLGFTRIRVEEGKRRALVIWEKPIGRETIPPTGAKFTFFVTLTHGPGETRRIIRLWDESGDSRNPFAYVIFTPLFSSPSAIRLIRQLKDDRGSVVMFDSGGYQVQMGRMSYEELFDNLLTFYRGNDWADWYVLPDHVPLSSDSNQEVEYKIQETLDFARLFLNKMPQEFVTRAVGVVHGRTEEQVSRCVNVYMEMGVRYIGFGSFGTSGPNGSVNMVSQKSLQLLRIVQHMAYKRGMRLHIFGIGSPGHLLRLRKSGIIPTSFDSASWWKAGAFGNIFFPGGSQLHITRISGYNATYEGIKREKQRAQHNCPFCVDLYKLRKSRILRIMHNLAAMLDTLEEVSKL